MIDSGKQKRAIARYRSPRAKQVVASTGELIASHVLARRFRRKRAVSLTVAVVCCMIATLVNPAAWAAAREVASSVVYSGTYEENDANIVYTGASWQTAASSQDSGGSSAMTTRSGSVILEFFGTGVSWQSRRTPSSGINDVFIDGIFHSSIDRYSPTTVYRETVFATSGLSRTSHTIEIRWTGSKNPLASGSNLLVDSLIVLDDEPPPAPTDLVAEPRGSGAVLSWSPVTTEPVTYAVAEVTPEGPVKIASNLASPTYTASGYPGDEELTFVVSSIDLSGNESEGSQPISVTTASSAKVGIHNDDSPYITYTGASWQASSSSQDRSGSALFTTRAGSASFTFEGTGVRWLSRLAPTAGINSVFVDGVQQQLVDRYDPTTKYQQVAFEATDLAFGLHTIRLEWTGQRNPQSGGDNLLIDAFEVTGGSIATPPADLQGIAMNGGIELAWTAAQSASTYVVSRLDDVTASWVDVSTGSASTSFIDGALPGGRDYFYRVSSIDEWGGRSEPSATVRVAAPRSAGPGRYENTNAQLFYLGSNWTLASSSSDSGGSSTVTSRAGTLRFAFEGTAIQWVSRLSATSGMARVTIDGGDPVTVDRYSATTQYQQIVFERRDLSPGSHVIEVTWLNERNPLSTSTSLVVDAFVVPDVTAPPPPTITSVERKGTGLVVSWDASDASDLAGYRITREDGVTASEAARVDATTASFEDAPLLPDELYTYSITAVDTSGNVSEPGRSTQASPGPAPRTGLYEDDSEFVTYRGSSWQPQSAYSDSGGTVRYTTRSGSASFTFFGPAIAWISRLSPSSGIATVYVDGVLVATVDRFSPTVSYAQVVYENRSLTNSTHTIEVMWTGQKNSAATGSNLTVDAFRVIDVAPPAAPTGIVVDSVRKGVSVTWSANNETDLAGYRVYRSLNSGGVQDVSGAIRDTTFIDVGVPFSTTVKYYVTAVDTSGNESLKSITRATASAAPPSMPAVRSTDCPSATTTVTTAAELRSALATVGPGSVIQLAPGTYRGSFTLSSGGSASSPAWICGPRDAIINGGSITLGQGLFLAGVSHVRVAGFSVTNSLKGLSVVGGDDVAISDMSLSNIGYEAIHLRGNATNSAVIGNVIRTTGRLDPSFGEGIYVGTSKENWCQLTACEPDRVVGATVALNNIAFTGAQPIEAKEGTSDGLIYKNRVDGAKGAENSNSWILVKGNDWVVDSNVGSAASGNGFSVIATGSEWGLGNVLTRNSATGPAAGFSIWLHKNNLGTLVGCENTQSGFASGLTNYGCQK